MKIKVKLTLMQTCAFAVALVVLVMGGWLITLVICAITATTLPNVSDEDAFINIDYDTRTKEE